MFCLRTASCHAQAGEPAALGENEKKAIEELWLKRDTRVLYAISNAHFLARVCIDASTWDMCCYTHHLNPGSQSCSTVSRQNRSA